jgi:hypothetical protein
MILKEGVRLQGLQPQMVVALLAAYHIWEQHGDLLTVTSCVDGKHSHTSLHYAGCALDFRTRDIKDQEIKTMALKAALGNDFDVLDEDDHIHVEYQPRRVS